MLQPKALPAKPPVPVKLTRAQLRDGRVLNRLDQMLAARPPGSPDTLNRDEVAALFGVAPATVTRWSGFLVGCLPRHYPDNTARLPRQGRLHRYHPDDIRAWVMDGHAPHAGRRADG